MSKRTARCNQLAVIKAVQSRVITVEESLTIQIPEPAEIDNEEVAAIAKLKP